MRPALPVRGTRAPSLLSDERARPVWPVWSAAQYQALSRIAELFGTRLRRIPRVWLGDSGSGESSVAWLGDGCEGPARLYAHLTGRSCRSRPFDPVRDIDCDVVVTVFPRIDPDLLEHLYPLSRDRRRSPGLIAGRTLAGLWTQVLIRSASARLAGAMAFRRVELHSGIDFEGRRFSTVPWRIMGGRTPAADVRHELTSGNALVALHGHSDGVDLQLLDDLTLCPQAGWKDLGAPHAPRCRRTGFCHRQDSPVDEAVRQTRLMVPETLAAGLLVTSCCAGYLLPGAVVDWRWGLGSRLAQSPTLGALITTWRLIYSSSSGAMVIADRLSQGLSAGEAVAEANDRGQSYCLFGDPRFRLGSPPAMAGLLSDMERPVAPLQSDAPPHDGAWTMDRLLSLRKMVDLWLPRAEQCERTTSGRPCPVCAAPSATILARAEEGWGGWRRVGICPRCGIVEDVPAQAPLRAISIDGSTGQLGVAGITGGGAFVLRSHDPAFHEVYPATAGTCRLPSRLLSRDEPLAVSFLWLEGGAVPAQIFRPFYPRPRAALAASQRASSGADAITLASARAYHSI